MRTQKLVLAVLAVAATATSQAETTPARTTRTKIADDKISSTTTLPQSEPTTIARAATLETTTTRTRTADAKGSTRTTTAAVPNSSTTTKFAVGAGCDVPQPDWIADAYCDSDHGNYNTLACGWDGGDCCQDTCVPQPDSSVVCGTPGFSCRDPTSAFAVACPLRDSGFWGDGFCDEFNNVLEAQEGATYVNLNTQACGWDGGDCCRSTCSQPLEKGGGSCTHTVEHCLDPGAPDVCHFVVDPDCDTFEGCAASFLSYIGDGWCDNDEHNVASCGWDGGDCCESTCLEWHRPGSNECGLSSPYVCLDPLAQEYTGLPVTTKPPASSTTLAPKSFTAATVTSRTTTQTAAATTALASTMTLRPTSTVAAYSTTTTTTVVPGSSTGNSDFGGSPGGRDQGDGSAGDSTMDNKTVVGIAVAVMAIVIIAGIAVGIAIAVKRSRSQRKNSSFGGVGGGSPFVRAHATSMRAEHSSAYATLDEPMANQGVTI